MSSSSNHTTKSSFDAFAQVDELVAKPVLGSDGAASWQEFRKDHSSSHRPSAAPKAPLKKSDKLGTGLTSWEEERSNESKIRTETGQASLGSGYTNFKNKESNEEAARKKKRKQIEARIRPDDKEYFIPSSTYTGYKFDYVFMTKPEYGTGYYWDGMDSIQQIRGGGSSNNDDQNGKEAEKRTGSKRALRTNSSSEFNKQVKSKKMKRKDAGPIIIENPNHPLEQVAMAIQKRNQRLMLGQQHGSTVTTQPTTHPLLQEGWQAAVDPTSNKTYYYCHATGERSWDMPRKNMNVTTTTTVTGTTATTTSTDTKEDSKNELPKGWKSVSDASTGKIYYYHTDGRTTWEKPTSG